MSDVALIPGASLKKTRQQLRKDRSEETPAYRNDVVIYRMVVVILGLVILAAVAGAFGASLRPDGKTPDLLIALGSGSLGALGGLLAPAPMANRR